MTASTINFSKITKVTGIKLGTSNANIKPTASDDIVVLEMIEGTTCAGVFTQNKFCAAPIHIAKNHIAQNPRWLLINSGNANAGTGEQGMRNAEQCCTSLAALTGGKNTQVLPFSTGVIGEDLPLEKIVKALPQAINNLQENNWQQAANAIMTTDTVAKASSLTVIIEGNPVIVTGIAKGSGMIHPNMATMLSFIATDATISQALLQHCLSAAVNQSFNTITVDGDTSTNDACVLMASGQSLAPEIMPNSSNYIIFAQAVLAVCCALAEAIVKDGEGATKLMRICVEQAKNDDEAVLVAKTVAHSPLVKTAFFANDPNWGRILAAVGRCDIAQMDINKIKIYLDDVCIVSNGGRAKTYSEAQGQQVMQEQDITIRIVLGRGNASQQVLTCDLSYDYVRINAEYRT